MSLLFCQPSCCCCCKSNDSSVTRAREFLEARHQVSVYPNNGLDFCQARKVIGGAFGGSTAERADELMLYALRDMDIRDRTTDRQEMVSFSMGFFLYELLHSKNGIAFGIRDEHDQVGQPSQDSANEFKAVVVFREYNPRVEERKGTFSFLINRIREFLRNMRAYLSMKSDSLGLPTILLNDKEKMHVFERCGIEQMSAQLKMWHSQYGPRVPHWYIGLVATDPNSQGQGFGRKVMNLLGQAADECNAVCYLESPKRNGGFYKKWGYTITQRISLEGVDDFSIPYSLMTRLPNHKPKL